MLANKNISLPLKENLSELNIWIERYKNLPSEAIIKMDILRLGLNFDINSIEKSQTYINQNYKIKDYFIFTFDHEPIKNQPEKIRFKMPEEIKINLGPFNLKDTVISVRFDKSSPYTIRFFQENFILTYNNEHLANVIFPPLPPYYNNISKSGKKPGEIAPVIEWGYLIYLTVFRNCQYFGQEEECAFCDINHNYRQQKNASRPYTGVKSLSEILEALEWIAKLDNVAEAYTITGGSIIKTLKNKNETDFYFEFAKGIEEKFPKRWISKIVTQAWEKDKLIPFKEIGIEIYHPNYEVWDERLFKLLCPGKEAFIGRETWIKRIIEAAEIFGPQGVIPNFVGGVEMSKPFGYKEIKDAINSTQIGLDFFMSHGIVPRFTTWCPEPYTTLSNLEKQDGAPLEYFLELLSIWKYTFEKYKLPIPRGYGKAGPGNAVFSVSAFMDVIGY